MLVPLNQAPIQTPIYNGQSMNPVWVKWLDGVWRALTGKVVVLPIAAAGVTPSGETGQVYLTNAGVLVTFNGTSWVQYDGSPAVF